MIAGTSQIKVADALVAWMKFGCLSFCFLKEIQVGPQPKGFAIQGGVIEISHETHIPYTYCHSCLCRCV